MKSKKPQSWVKVNYSYTLLGRKIEKKSQKIFEGKTFSTQTSKIKSRSSYTSIIPTISNISQLVRQGASDMLCFCAMHHACINHSVEQCNVVQEIPARWVYGATFEINAMCTMHDCMMQCPCSVTLHFVHRTAYAHDGKTTYNMTVLQALHLCNIFRENIHWGDDFSRIDYFYDSYGIYMETLHTSSK